METSYIGKSIPRVDSAEKVTGRAIYSADLDFAGMLSGAALRSPYPHARILEIDVSEARKIPGVQAVVTEKDFPGKAVDMLENVLVAAKNKGVKRLDKQAVAGLAEHELNVKVAEATGGVVINQSGTANAASCAARALCCKSRRSWP